MVKHYGPVSPHDTSIYVPTGIVMWHIRPGAAHTGQMASAALAQYPSLSEEAEASMHWSMQYKD